MVFCPELCTKDLGTERALRGFAVLLLQLFPDFYEENHKLIICYLHQKAGCEVTKNCLNLETEILQKKRKHNKAQNKQEKKKQTKTSKTKQTAELLS